MALHAFDLPPALGPIVSVEWTHGDESGFAWMQVVPPSMCGGCGDTLDPMDCVETVEDGWGRDAEPIVVCPREGCGWTDNEPCLRPAAEPQEEECVHD